MLVCHTNAKCTCLMGTVFDRDCVRLRLCPIGTVSEKYRPVRLICAQSGLILLLTHITTKILKNVIAIFVIRKIARSLLQKFFGKIIKIKIFSPEVSPEVSPDLHYMADYRFRIVNATFQERRLNQYSQSPLIYIYSSFLYNVLYL